MTEKTTAREYVQCGCTAQTVIDVEGQEITPDSMDELKATGWEYIGTAWVCPRCGIDSLRAQLAEAGEEINRLEAEVTKACDIIGDQDEALVEARVREKGLLSAIDRYLRSKYPRGTRHLVDREADHLRTAVRVVRQAAVLTPYEAGEVES